MKYIITQYPVAPAAKLGCFEAKTLTKAVADFSKEYGKELQPAEVKNPFGCPGFSDGQLDFIVISGPLMWDHATTLLQLTLNEN